MRRLGARGKPGMGHVIFKGVVCALPIWAREETTHGFCRAGELFRGVSMEATRLLGFIAPAYVDTYV